MESQIVFSALRDALAELYPEEQTARIVVDDAGLDVRQIAFSSRAQTNWHTILTEARHQNRLKELLQVALSTYGDNPPLLAAYQQYCYFIEQESHATRESSSDFQPSHEIEPPYGTMQPDSAFYVVRHADETCLNYFNRSKATTIYVQSPRQMGKSSLMQHIVYRLKHKHELETVFIDCEKFSEAQLSNLEDFLIELCYMIGEALNIPEAIDKYWSSSRRSVLIKCSNYLSKHIIPAIDRPLILAMDEVERILGTPFQNDFFGMLRTWHNDRSHDATFAKMSLFLSSSTEPQLFIDNPNQSPFNVAQPILLYDFEDAEIQKLNQRHPIQLAQNQLADLTDLLNGHPFLTRLSLYLVATRQYDFPTLQQTATFEDGPFGNHLNYFWQKISDSPELQRVLVQICRHQTYPADKLYYRLKGAGLIKRVNEKVVMRNRLYERYFSERLNV